MNLWGMEKTQNHLKTLKNKTQYAFMIKKTQQIVKRKELSQHNTRGWKKKPIANIILTGED